MLRRGVARGEGCGEVVVRAPLAPRPMAGHRTLDPGMVVRVHRGQSPTRKKRAGWPDPRPRCVLPASTLRLGLVGLRLLRLLDLAIGRALGLLRFSRGQAEVLERLTDAVAAAQAGQDVRYGDVGVLTAEVLGEHVRGDELAPRELRVQRDRKSTRLNSSHLVISYAVFCLKKKK